MAVKVADRSESSIQFLETARKLYAYTISTLMHFPKRIQFYISLPISRTCTRFYTSVINGNAINVKTKEDFIQRRQNFQDALGELDVLEGQINLLYSDFSAATFTYKSTRRRIAPKAPEIWANFVSMERRLLKGLLNKEFDKYKELYNL